MKKLLILMLFMIAAAPLYAAEGELATFGIALGAGLAISLSALGGAIGQGIAVNAALTGIARNPNAFIPEPLAYRLSFISRALIRLSTLSKKNIRA